MPGEDLTLLPILRDEVYPAKHRKRPGPEVLPAVVAGNRNRGVRTGTLANILRQAGLRRTS